MSQKSDQSKIEYGAGYITLMPEGYFYVQMKNQSNSTVETVKESQRIMVEMLPEGPVFILVDAGVGSTSDDEIYDYINKSVFKTRVKAQAIIVHDLATRLMGNIFLRFVKGERHIKIFSKIEDAREWLFKRMISEENGGEKPKRFLVV